MYGNINICSKRQCLCRIFQEGVAGRDGGGMNKFCFREGGNCKSYIKKKWKGCANIVHHS